MSRDEEELKEAFGQLREEQEPLTPAYRTLMARRSAAGEAVATGSPARWWIPGLTAAAAVAALLVWSARGPGIAPAEPPWTPGQWAMPTDVLLDLSAIPGDELLHELPELTPTPIRPPEGAHHHDTRRRTLA